MRKLLLLYLLIGSVAVDRSQALSADDLATREGEIVFGQAWLKSTRSRLGERIDPFCIDLLETWLTRLKNQFDLGTMPMTALCHHNGQVQRQKSQYRENDVLRQWLIPPTARRRHNKSPPYRVFCDGR